MPEHTLSEDYFERLYAERDDPWAYETSPYEEAKYDATLGALPRPRYASALEIGCSIGVLTERLAARCGRLLALDGAARALEHARARCRALGHVRFQERTVPASFPDGLFDLVLLSEVGYYLSPPDLNRLRERLVQHLGPGGHLVLVHWLAPVPGCALTGDEVHASFLADARFRPLAAHRQPQYRLDVLEAVSRQVADGQRS